MYALVKKLTYTYILYYTAAMSPTVTPTVTPTNSPNLAFATTTFPPPTENSNVPADNTTTTDDTTDTDDTTIDSPIQTQSIQLDDFTLSIVVPSRIERRMLRTGVPYNQLEFTQITNAHIYNHLEKELNVAAVNLRITSSQVTSLQGSTIVKEQMSGTVEFHDTLSLSSTVNTLVLQSLEGQDLWEYFFRLRGAQDPYLKKTQQVTLVDTTSLANGSGSTFSTGVIITLVVIGLVTAGIVGYFVYWLKKQNHVEAVDDKKQNAETPDTHEGNFFSDTPPETRNNKSFRKHDEVSVGNLSFVSSVNSALHSIRERSLEDEEEEPDENEPKSSDKLWGDDSASEIEVQTELVENMPPFREEVIEEYGQIRRIMPLETRYSTNTGTEVTRREVQVALTKKPTEKPANRWIMWKKSTTRQQKKNAAAKHRHAVAQMKLAEKKMLAESRMQLQHHRQAPPPPVNTSFNDHLDPPSLVDMTLDPPSQVDMSGLETSLDPPSQMELDVPSFQSDTSLDGESIQLSEF